MTVALDRPAPAHDDTTRRQFLISGASFAALLAGCATAEPTQEPVDGNPATMVGQR